MKLPETIPENLRREAYQQWRSVGPKLAGNVLLTYFPMGMLVAATSKAVEHPISGHKTVNTHKDKYINAGSSGLWVYMASPHQWLDNHNNLEDGSYGEDSGKWSATVSGNESTWWNQYKYLCRNPFNKGKRTNPEYFCPVNDCTIRWWGTKEVLSDKDNNPMTKGWYFVIATHRDTGKKYYGYRSVELLDNENVRQVNIGFKIKPTHATEWQDKDDEDKAFTLRYQHKSKID
jgi:hypothetical protein